MSDLLTVVPARGGSQRLKRKNILPYRGVPLFIHTARQLDDPIIATDDKEIAAIARIHGYRYYWRDPVGPDQIIPEVAKEVGEFFDWPGPMLVVQPTVQDFAQISPALNYGEAPEIPTVFSYHERHCHWVQGTLQMERKTEVEHEVGIYYWPAGTIGDLPELCYGLGKPFYDIDTPVDYRAASLERKKISIIAAEPDTWSGTGHKRRMETLALQLQHHEVFFAHHPHADLIIYDKGNIGSKDIDWSIPIVTFEDVGEYARYANLVVNSFWKGDDNRVLGGPRYAVLRSEFLGLPEFEYRKEAKRVMVSFGGTDAERLGDWVDKTLSPHGFSINRPRENSSMAEMMLDSDLIVCGTGQTLHEAAMVGIPAISIAATKRESEHGHVDDTVHLGLHSTVSEMDLGRVVDRTMENRRLRKEIGQRAKQRIDGKGTERIVHRIEGLLRGL